MLFFSQISPLNWVFIFVFQLLFFILFLKVLYWEIFKEMMKMKIFKWSVSLSFIW